MCTSEHFNKFLFAQPVVVYFIKSGIYFFAWLLNHSKQHYEQIMVTQVFFHLTFFLKYLIMITTNISSSNFSIPIASLVVTVQYIAPAFF